MTPTDQEIRDAWWRWLTSLTAEELARFLTKVDWMAKNETTPRETASKHK